MPRQKDLKRLARSRMAKTGESYTTARARLLEKKKARKAASPEIGAAAKSAKSPAAKVVKSPAAKVVKSPAAKVVRSPAAKQVKSPAGQLVKSPVAGSTGKPAAADLARLAEQAGMSDDAVRAKTGRTWAEWVETLDAVDAASKPHKEIAEHVHAEHGVPGWWAQTVTVGYERIKGLREIGQRRSGAYEANKSKTLSVPLAALYRAFSDKRIRNRWLPGAELTVRTATPEKSMRITWEEDGTSVEVYFYAKGKEKSQVALQHRKLPSKAAAEKRKKFWAERLTALAELLAR